MILDLIRKYKNKGVIIDTNLMLLLVIGTYDPNKIETFKRTLKYTAADFALLLKLISQFERRITTPNILTEVDNLSRQMPEKDYEGISSSFETLVKNFVEIYTASTEIIGSDLHKKLGITDGIITAGSSEFLIVTDDFPLANRLGAMKRDAININHLREYLTR